MVSSVPLASFSDFSVVGLVTFWKKLPKMEVRLFFAGASAFFSSFLSSVASAAAGA